jgi:SAM-dependent methyltransferase
MKKDYVAVTAEGPQEPEAAFVERFWTKHWQGQGPLPDPGQVSRRVEYQLMRPFLERLPKGARILDGGCGLGEWVVHLTNQGFEAVGIDLSRLTIERLRAQLPRQQFACGDIRRMDFPDASFDAYYSWGTFEHFEIGLGPCMLEARRILKPGGWLFITVPFQNARHRRRDLRPLGRWDEGFDPQLGFRQPMRFYQWRLTEPELHRELALQGFRVQWIRPIHTGQGVRRMLQWSVPALRAGSLPFRIALRALTLVLPVRSVGHMIMACAQKPSTEDA